MSFVDFIRNRAANQQAAAKDAQQPKPDTAKQVEEKAKPLDRMPPEQQAKVEEIKARLQKATQHIDKSPAAPAPAPADGADSREAMRQKMTGQEKAAPALSPTSAQAGQPASETHSPSPTRQTVTKAPPTVPRRPPSWER